MQWIIERLSSASAGAECSWSVGTCCWITALKSDRNWLMWSDTWLSLHKQSKNGNYSHMYLYACVHVYAHVWMCVFVCVHMCMVSNSKKADPLINKETKNINTINKRNFLFVSYTFASLCGSLQPKMFF